MSGYDHMVSVIMSKSRKYSFKESIIIIALQEVEQVIKNYCRVPQVPKALTFTWCNMALDLLIYEHEANLVSDQNQIDSADITDIKIGDTSVSVGSKSSNTQRSKILSSHKYNLDDIVLNYRNQLNQFRRLF